MDWLLYLTLAGLLLTGLFLNIVGLPGLWLMVAAHAAFGWITGWRFVWWQSSLAMLLLATAAEVAEFAAGAAGSKSAGGTIRSMVGAIIGGIVGGIVGQIFIPIPIVGAVLGACIGSFAGASMLEATFANPEVEDRAMHWGRVQRVGWGAFKGRLVGILLKTGFGVVMLVVSLWTAWG